MVEIGGWNGGDRCKTKKLLIMHACMQVRQLHVFSIHCQTSRWIKSCEDCVTLQPGSLVDHISLVGIGHDRHPITDRLWLGRQALCSKDYSELLFGWCETVGCVFQELNSSISSKLGWISRPACAICVGICQISTSHLHDQHRSTCFQTDDEFRTILSASQPPGTDCFVRGRPSRRINRHSR